MDDKSIVIKRDLPELTAGYYRLTGKSDGLVEGRETLVSIYHGVVVEGYGKFETETLSERWRALYPNMSQDVMVVTPGEAEVYRTTGTFQKLQTTMENPFVAYDTRQPIDKHGDWHPRTPSGRTGIVDTEPCPYGHVGHKWVIFGRDFTDEKPPFERSLVVRVSNIRIDFVESTPVWVVSFEEVRSEENDRLTGRITPVIVDEAVNGADGKSWLPEFSLASKPVVLRGEPVSKLKPAGTEELEEGEL